jgi:hypothetical protein
MCDGALGTPCICAGGETVHYLQMIRDFATAQENWDDRGSYLNYSTLTGDHSYDRFHFLKIP